ncbi:MAG: glutaredoxin family protein [Candidatus Saccharibacteria bacterium]
MNSPIQPIIIYSTITCPNCHQAIEWLDANKVKYEVRDFYGFPGALEDILANVGMTFHLPVIRYGNQYVVGHNQPKLEKLITSAGYDLVSKQ